MPPRGRSSAEAQRLGAVPVDEATDAVEDLPDRRGRLLATAGAVEAVLKFFRPDATPASMVPGSAFWSTTGRALWADQPGRFPYVRLLSARDAYHWSAQQNGEVP